MTVKEWIKKNGWQTECDITGAERMSVDIDFVNPDGKNDETQFDIKAYDIAELSTLFTEFCRENQFAVNTVTSITIVAVDEMMDAD